MATRASKLPNQDQERQQLLDDMKAEHGPGWSEQYQPGSFGCHELLDRAMLAATIVEEHVLNHPACARKREWYALAEKAATALQELYQKVGAEHLSEMDK